MLLDVRTGDGWLNPPAQKLLPFFKHMAKVVPNHYPERLKRVVIYPLPWIVAALIKVVKNLFDPVTREKFIVLSGSDKTGAPCPVDLGEYVTRAGLPDHGRAIHLELPEWAESTSPRCRVGPRGGRPLVPPVASDDLALPLAVDPVTPLVRAASVLGAGGPRHHHFAAFDAAAKSGRPSHHCARCSDATPSFMFPAKMFARSLAGSASSMHFIALSFASTCRAPSARR